MVTGDLGRRLVVGALVGVLLAVAVVPGPGGASVVADGAGGSAHGPAVAPQQETPTNATVRHEDPETVNRQGDLADVERYLAGRLSGRLEEGSVAISQGEYEAARSVLGDEYDAQLARYVDVAGETEGEADDAAAESFREAGEDVRTFANESARFNETDRAYQRASERGNATRARTLARELVTRAREVNRTGSRIGDAYGELGNRTGRDLTGARDRVETVSRNATERAEAVVEATFTRTRLEATAAPTTVSFRRPTTVRGRLVTENGTDLANRTVLVGNASEAVRAETNATGWFEATYRPARLPVEPGEVPVRFAPTNASVYLGNRTTVPVTVEPVTPTVTAAVTPEAAAFGDVVTVRGAVAVEGMAAAGVPVLVSVDGVRLARVETNGSGRFAASRRLTADVRSGGRAVEVRVDQVGRAVASASTTAPLAVESTATAIGVDGTLGANETVLVSGRLRTVDGTGVENRSVELLVDGTTVERVRTGPNGRFSARVPPGAYEVDADGNVTVAARFDGTGTNLDGSRATVTVAAPWIDRGGSTGGLPWWQWLAVAVAVGAVGGLLAWRRRGREPEDAGGALAETAGGSGARPSDPGEGAWRGDVATLLAAGETDRAVARAYGAARARLADELGVSRALTHWEFYAAATDDGVGHERVAALLALTEAYERAQFSPATVSAGDAAAAVDSAGDVLSG